MLKSRAHQNFFSMKHGLLFLLSALLLTTCKEPQKEGIETITTDEKISSIIRNPVTADRLQDTVNVAKISFAERRYHFGKVKEGKKVEHVFEFTNTGRIPLIISDARSTCGCTVPHWPKEAIPPGGKGQIKVVFNTSGKRNEQKKPITITANTYPSETTIYLIGYVENDEQ